MATIKKLFTEHPATVGETYLEHVSTALSFSVSLFLASLCCLIHSVLPFVFEKTGSRLVTGLYSRMVTNRSRLPAQESLGAEWSDYTV